MNTFSLTFANLRHSWQRTLYTTLLFAVGTALMALVLNLGSQFSSSLTRNLQGVDLVVGAKGSPLQLVLSSVLHADVPTGNIPLDEAEKLGNNPMIKATIPLSLGDNVQGYRIVGTTPAYVDLYDGKLAEGTLWQDEMQAVLGSEVAATLGLKPGQTFAGNHGLAAGGELHSDFPYTVTGILAPTGTILDRLALTGLESVWHIHEHHHHHDDDKAEEEEHEHHDAHEHENEHHHEHAHEEEHHHDEHGHEHEEEYEHADEREITALLVQYASPLAVATLPRLINQTTNMQAASPALEATRLRALVGIGGTALLWFGALLTGLAALGLLITMAEAMRQRLYDIALMRCFGAPPSRVVKLVVLEGLAISLAGGVLGLFISWLGAGFAASHLLGGQLNQGAQLSPQVLGLILAVVVALGVLGSLLPALKIYRLNLPKVLAFGQ